MKYIIKKQINNQSIYYIGGFHVWGSKYKAVSFDYDYEAKRASKILKGSFDSKYIVRIDGDIEKDAELLIKED